MHVKASPEPVAPKVSGHCGAERALTAGPWHQEWPFHCYYCNHKYSDNAYFPYCSSQCGLYAEHS